MSFLPGAPRRIFFYGHTPAKTGGETPLTDFRLVWQQMDPQVRQAFETKGVRHVRNYNGNGFNLSIDPTKTKKWPDMFKTTNKAEVDQKCQESGQQHEWHGNGLRLINNAQAYQKHPVTGTPVWFNHSQVFHTVGPYHEARYIASRQKGFRANFVKNMLRFMSGLVGRLQPLEGRGTNALFADGSPIPNSYIAHIQDLIWQNMVFLQWQKGDVVAVDNYAVAHGRLPFTGPRKIYVAWTDGYDNNQPN